jgi:hypothetical protein
MAALAALRQRAAQVAAAAGAAASPAARAARAELDKVLAANAEHVVKDPVAADKLLKQWAFTKLSR